MLSPSESFGAIYGTRNMVRPPSKPAVPAGGASTTGDRAPSATGHSSLKAIQNAFRQPPADLSRFADYERSEGYLQLMEKLGGDPGLLTLLAANHLALDITSIDHTTQGIKAQVGGETKTLFETTYGEQFGPPRTSRAMAMVQLAIFEAINAIDPRYESYKPDGSTDSIRSRIVAMLPDRTVLDSSKASIPAAINQAAHDVLVALYPRKSAYIDAGTLRISIAVNSDEVAKASGAGDAAIELGSRIGAEAAAAVVKARQDDGSTPRRSDLCRRPVADEDPRTVLPTSLCYETYFKPMTVAEMQKEGKAQPFRWTIDPVSRGPLRLGSDWGEIEPFAMKRHEFVKGDGLHLANNVVLALPKETDADFKSGLDGDAYGPDRTDPHDASKKVKSKYGVRSFGAAALNPRGDDRTFEAQFWGYDASALLCAPPRLYNMVATAFLDDHPDKLGQDHQAVAAARYLALVNVALADAAIAAWDAKYSYDIARPVTYIRYHTLDSRPDDDHWTPLGSGRLQRPPGQHDAGIPLVPFGPRGLRRRRFRDDRQGLERRQDERQRIQFHVRRIQRPHLRVRR